MCRRIGVEWKCRHRWFAWVHCDNAPAQGKYGEECLLSDADSRDAARHGRVEIDSEHVLNLPWHCAPVCCQHAIDSETERVEVLRKAYNTARWAICSKEVLDMHFKNFDEASSRFATHCVWNCLSRFKENFWRSNSMRAGMYDTAAIEFVPSVSEYLQGENLGLSGASNAYFQSLKVPPTLYTSTALNSLGHYEKLKEGWLRIQEKEYTPSTTIQGWHADLPDAQIIKAGCTGPEMRAPSLFICALPLSDVKRLGESFLDNLCQNMDEVASCAKDQTQQIAPPAVCGVLQMKAWHAAQLVEFEKLHAALQRLEQIFIVRIWSPDERKRVEKSLHAAKLAVDGLKAMIDIANAQRSVQSTRRVSFIMPKE